MMEIAPPPVATGPGTPTGRGRGPSPRRPRAEARMRRRRPQRRKPIGRRDLRLLSLTEAQIDERVRGLLELRGYRRDGNRFLEAALGRAPRRGREATCKPWEAAGLLNLLCFVELADLKARHKRAKQDKRRAVQYQRDQGYEI